MASCGSNYQTLTVKGTQSKAENVEMSNRGKNTCKAAEEECTCKWTISYVIGIWNLSAWSHWRAILDWCDFALPSSSLHKRIPDPILKGDSNWSQGSWTWLTYTWNINCSRTAVSTYWGCYLLLSKAWTVNCT